MFYLDWRFSLIGLSISPLLFVIVYRITRRIKRATRAVKRQESELASVVQESIASARVVKAFAREEFEEAARPREGGSMRAWTACRTRRRTPVARESHWVS